MAGAGHGGVAGGGLLLQFLYFRLPRGYALRPVGGRVRRGANGGKRIMNQKISVFILAYNSEANIGPALESAQWADEIVVIDSHSTDRTGAIAEKHGARVVQIDFEGFGKLRIAGIEHTTHDWIFSLDTDERCTPEARDEILKIINILFCNIIFYSLSIF